MKELVFGIVIGVGMTNFVWDITLHIKNHKKQKGKPENMLLSKQDIIFFIDTGKLDNIIAGITSENIPSSIRSNRKWCKRRGSSLQCQNCFFVYTIIDSNLKNLARCIRT